MSNFKKAQQEIKDLLITGFEIEMYENENIPYTYHGDYFDVVCKIEDNRVYIEEINYDEVYPNTNPVTDKQIDRLEELLNEINALDLNEDRDDYSSRGIRRSDFF